jgi:FixJ family two-component response regulator
VALSRDGSVTKDVIVVAADAAFRRSLAFLFEAEGFMVSSHDRIPSQTRPPGERVGCVIVDDASMDFGSNGWDQLSALAETAVILCSRVRALPSDMVILTIEKPFLGADLVDAVRAANLQYPASK